MRKPNLTILSVLLALAALLGAAGCGDGVSSEEKAQEAYEGLDASIDRAIKLGFKGFNAATSANIDDQTENGNVTGTMTIGGKVDQGSSSNKTMNLTEKLVEYCDDGKHTYDTDDAALPTLDMKLSKVPTGTLNGTLAGKYKLTGDIEGTVTLNLTFTGDLQDDGSGGVERKPNTTHITGTADSDYGTYDVDLTR